MDRLAEFWPHILGVSSGIAALLAAGHVILHKRDPRAAALWLGLVMLAPAIGALLYLLIGINRMPRRAVRRTQVTRSSAVLDHHQVASAEDRFADGPLVRGNAITPLCDGDEAYPAMIAAIAEARDNVLLSTYIFDNDRAGARFADAMADAVGRGVEVRVMVDSVGARYTFPSIIGRLRRSGVQVRRFSPSLMPWRMRYANLRSHRKLLVVDGRVGFTGGLNIRESCLLELEPARPTKDLHFRVDGPVVAELQRTLVEDWEFTAGEQLTGERFFPPLEPCGEVVARALADGPDRLHDPIRWHKLALVARARQRVRIATPYFVPDPPIVAALNTAAMNGTRVEVLLPSVNNLRLVAWASTALLWQILEHGCHVFLAAPPFDHSKLLLVDDDRATFGSANWDARSFRLNFEFDLECRDRELTSRLHKLFDQRLATAREITLADVDGRSIPIRLRDGIARLFAPYL